MGGHSLCRPPQVGTVCGRRSRRGINHAATVKPRVFHYVNLQSATVKPRVFHYLNLLSATVKPRVFHYLNLLSAAVKPRVFHYLNLKQK